MDNSRSSRLDGYAEAFKMLKSMTYRLTVLLLPGVVSVWHLSMQPRCIGIYSTLDLKTAFLQGETYDLDRRVIHVQLPTDIGLPPYLVGLCTRSVYGLADAPRRWWNRLDKFLISLGIQPTRADRCTYVCYDRAFKEPKQVSFADSEATEPAPVSPTLLRKFISLFWLKKDCFQLAINKTKHGNKEKNLRRRRVKIVHGLLLLMTPC